MTNKEPVKIRYRSQRIGISPFHNYVLVLQIYDESIGEPTPGIWRDATTQDLTENIL